MGAGGGGGEFRPPSSKTLGISEIVGPIRDVVALDRKVKGGTKIGGCGDGRGERRCGGYRVVSGLGGAAG